VLDDERLAAEQLAIHQNYGATKVRYGLIPSVLPALINQDETQLNRALAKSCRRFWQWAQKAGVLDCLGMDGNYTYNCRKGCENMATGLWPYLEFAVARLACQLGIKIAYDDFFLPRDLITFPGTPSRSWVPPLLPEKTREQIRGSQRRSGNSQRT